MEQKCDKIKDQVVQWNVTILLSLWDYLNKFGNNGLLLQIICGPLLNAAWFWAKDCSSQRFHII